MDPAPRERPPDPSTHTLSLSHVPPLPHLSTPIRSTVGVLSAMFGVTNRLLDAAQHAMKGDQEGVEKLRSALLDAHVNAAKSEECVCLRG